MLHPDTRREFRTPEIGDGVVATRLIPRGTVIWVRDPLDLSITKQTFRLFPPSVREQIDKYTFYGEDDLMILCWDLARYTNHSCDPNSLTIRTDFTIAIRDIHPGEEFAEDYALLNLHEDQTFDCHCGAAQCRKRVGPHDVATQSDKWRDAISGAMALMDQVRQPLKFLLRAECLDRARAYCATVAAS